MFKKVFPWSRESRRVEAERADVFVAGERVVLREKSVTDISDDYKWRTDAELAELDATRPLNMSLRQFEKYAVQEMQYPDTRSKRLSVDTACGVHIGNVMFYDIDLRSKRAELGIMIGDKDYWGQGYGTETVGLLLDHMFGAYPFDRIYLHTLTWNHRAQKSFQKSGFKEVRPVRKGGYDFIQMEIYRREWEALRAQSPSPLAGEGWDGGKSA